MDHPLTHAVVEIVPSGSDADLLPAAPEGWTTR